MFIISTFKKLDISRQATWVKLSAQKYGNILNRSSLLSMLKNLEQDFPNSKINLGQLNYILIHKLSLFKELKIIHKSNPVKRLIPTYTEVSPLEIALSLVGKKAFLSHLSALYVHGLTNLIPTYIYVNEEQFPKPVNKSNAILTQNKIDRAFIRPVRATTNIATFLYKNTAYNVIILNGKSTNNIGVIRFDGTNFTKGVRVSNPERALIEAVVRPNYAGGTKETLAAFERGKDTLISINKLMAQLKKFNYIYPYEQAVYFYAKHAGYSQSQLELIKARFRKSQINFYLDHQMVNLTLDNDAKVYYPKELL